MDFFTRQDQARRGTKWLVVYFILAILLMTAGIYLVCLLIFAGMGAQLWNPPLLAGVFVVTLLIILIGSISKSIALRGGGGAVARALGGRPLDPAPQTMEEQRLRNVVEEMAIASGMAVPEIYLLDHESGINAFAAGYTPADAAVGVTRGALQTLDRDELQGVIAHEFSHILNGDMRLNVRLIGLVHGILCLTIIGRVLLRTGARRAYVLGARQRGGNPLPLLGLALIILGAIGVFFGRLIKSAISRQREFLADAAAVQFTRNPAGLAGALKKIGGRGSQLRTPHAEEASHLFFSNGLKPAWMQWWATHPPLIDRIRALEPSFDGTFPRIEITAAPPPDQAPPLTSDRPPRIIPPPRLEELMGHAAAAAGFAAQPIRADHAISTTGQPTPMHLVYAAAWRTGLPEALDRAAHDPVAAPALICALLLSADGEVRRRQLDGLAGRLESDAHQKLLELAPLLQKPDPQLRLPLVDLSLNALRRLTPAQYENFMATVRWIITEDRQIELFEFALQHILSHHLDPHFRPARRPIVQYYALPPLLADGRMLISALAWIGHHDPAEASRAFRSGYTTLDPTPRMEPLPLAQCGLDALNQALDRFAQASPQIKKRLLNAAAQTVAADGFIQPGEAELIRAIGDSLDCPIPPLLQI